MTAGSLYRAVRARFREAGLETPDLDARILVASALGFTPSDLLLKEDEPVAPSSRLLAEDYSAKRLSGLPVGRILGRREFWGMEFLLNEATLEPRPDTETLVEAVLARCDQGRAFKFADIGTGTGAIAIALLTECTQAIGVAVDVSLAALSCASQNAARLGVRGRFLPLQANYLDALNKDLDWIVSNPPYIRTDVVKTLSKEVREHDPDLALDGGEDGLSAYRNIIARAGAILGQGGRIALEIGFDQAADVSGLLSEHGFSDIEIITDLAGKDRILAAVRW